MNYSKDVFAISAACQLNNISHQDQDEAYLRWLEDQLQILAFEGNDVADAEPLWEDLLMFELLTD